MVVAAVVSLGLAVLIGGSGIWTLRRPAPADLNGQVQRAVAPTQVAAGVMLAAGGIMALVAPQSIGLIGLIVGLVGAIATVGAGSWQGARYATSRQSAGGCMSREGSGDGCGGCGKICGSSNPV